MAVRQGLRPMACDSSLSPDGRERSDSEITYGVRSNINSTPSRCWMNSDSLTQRNDLRIHRLQSLEDVTLSEAGAILAAGGFCFSVTKASLKTSW